jgi:ketosteroid isomerase-like protein
MSQENMEIVRRNREALQRGDIDAFLEGIDPGLEIDFSEVRGPNRGVFHGHDGARELFDSFWEAWESVTPLSTDYIEVDDKVVLAGRSSFRGRGSGIEVEAGMGAVYTLRGGKIVRYKQLQSRAEALEAAGLRE